MMKKRLIPILLSVLFVFSCFMTTTAFAASPASQDGLTAILTSSKTAYAANEDIDLSLTVTNNNAYTVHNIHTAITLPYGAAANGSLTKNAFNLAAGESSTNTLTEIKLDIKPLQIPQTGDSSSIAIWLTVMLVSAGALVFIAIKNRKIKSKGVLSLFLCMAILGTIGLPVSANAASTQKSFTATKDLTVEGRTFTVSAEIFYDYVVHNTVDNRVRNTVTVTGGTGSATYAEGDTVTITADAPATGYHFTGWTVVGGGVTLANANDTTTTFTMPDKAVEVKADYAINTYTITASAEDNGTISPSGTVRVNYGERQAFSFSANYGYHIKDVTVDGTSVGAVSSYTFENVMADHTIHVTFEPNPVVKIRSTIKDWDQVPAFTGTATAVSEGSSRIALQSSVLSTRATADGTWDNGNAVAVALESEVKRYTAQSSGSTTTLEPADTENAFYRPSTEDIKVSAWYPIQNGDNSSSLPSTWTVQQNQNENNGYQNSDFLYAPQQKIYSNGTNSLTFYHQVAKVVVNIRNYGVTDDAALSVTINAVTQGTFTKPLSSDNYGTWSQNNSGSYPITPLKLDSPNTNVVFVDRQDGEAALASYQALVIPQDSGSSDIKIKIGEATYKYTPPQNTRKGGHEYTYNLTIEKE